MTFSDLNIDIGRRLSGQVYTICPKCSHDRKKKTNKCLGVNIDKGIWHCMHCNWSGGLQKKQYSLPKWDNATSLPDNVVEWFLKRNIKQETLVEMGITEKREYMPQVQSERHVVCFPYLRDKVVCNVKYRTPDKHFKMYKDAELIFYNIDGIKGQEECIIVEGEIDALTLIQLGYKNTISVPNGASKGTNNMQYLDNCYQEFEAMKSVVICTDNDEPGNNLANELARRIGVEKCSRALLGEFKDVNEMYCKTGKVEFDVKPFPIEGVYGVGDHWDAMLSLLKNGFPKGWKPRGKLGNHLSIHPGYTTIITGIPGHGKSEIIDQLCLQLSLDYNLKGAYFSPENRPTEVHLLKLVEKLIGKSAFKTEAMLLEKARQFLEDRYFWLYPSDGYNLDNILEKARQAVLKYGVNWFVIDPWNKLEHQYTESETKHISESLDKIANFNHVNGTHCFIVAHPRKMSMDGEKFTVPSLYDISGSANFYNKADIGLVMYKESDGVNTLFIPKVKFKYWGDGVGEIPQYWDRANGRYTDTGIDPTNWLATPAKAESINFYEKDDTPF